MEEKQVPSSVCFTVKTTAPALDPAVRGLLVEEIQQNLYDIFLPYGTGQPS